MEKLVYGLGREKPEHVGDRYVAPPALLDNLPDSVDPRTRLSAPWPVGWQGPWNTCTAQVVGGAVWYLALVGGDAFQPSRLFTYYGACPTRCATPSAQPEFSQRVTTARCGIGAALQGDRDRPFAAIGAPLPRAPTPPYLMITSRSVGNDL